MQKSFQPNKPLKSNESEINNELIYIVKYFLFIYFYKIDCYM